MIMATMVRPEVLLLDEHTAALDPKTARHDSGPDRRDWWAPRKLTTLMVTHNMRQAITAWATDLIMFHRGRDGGWTFPGTTRRIWRLTI